ncbi:MAG: hypothetical protein GTN80_01025 [Nitrososphaeria archaeon]|nr:hypothetical protein [Nitrososphaeria archaeon]NIQ32228.1 hypothetical protein [Nitrososphaeria archaeon]
MTRVEAQTPQSREKILPSAHTPRPTNVMLQRPVHTEVNTAPTLNPKEALKVPHSESP